MTMPAFTAGPVGLPTAPSKCQASRTIDDVVDEIGLGHAQLACAIGGGCMFFISSATKELLTLVTTAVDTDLKLLEVQKGVLFSVVFVGMACSNLLSGFFADRYGRRRVALVLSVMLIVMNSGLAASSSFLSLLAWRFGLGLTSGCTPALVTLFGEISPSDSRLFVNALTSLAFSAGALYSILLVSTQDPNLENLDWRVLTMLVSSMCLFLVPIVYLLLMESPRFLSRAGRREEAEQNLALMRSFNGRPGVDVMDWEAGEEVSEVGVAAIFQQGTRLITFVLCVSTISLNYTYWGASYVLPQILPQLGLPMNAAKSLLMMLAFDVAGNFSAPVLERLASRKGNVLMYLFANFVFGLCFAVGFTMPGGHLRSTLLICGMAGLSFSVSVGYCVIYNFAAEVYPTSCRATGAATAIAVGRLGSIMAPIILELLEPRFGSSGHFIVVILVSLLNACVVLALPVETKDRQLTSIIEEILPMSGRSDKNA